MGTKSTDPGVSNVDNARSPGLEVVDAFFRPRSVAIFGGLTEENKIGSRVLRSLMNNDYPGRIHLISKSSVSRSGYESVPTLDDVPGPVDLAVLCVPAEAAPSVVADCASHNVRGLIIVSSGFAEAGERGKQLQKEIVAAVGESGLRFIGPNSLGVVSRSDRTFANFSPTLVSEGFDNSISIVSQGGGYVGVLSNLLSLCGMSLGRVATVGNEADLSIIEFFRWYGEDPETQVICSYIEQVRDPQRFVTEIPLVATRKPIIAVKAGRSAAGSLAASSHTGALAGAAPVAAGAFRQAGILEAESVYEMSAMATAFVSARGRRAGRRVVVLTQSGSFAVEAIDLLRLSGLEVPALAHATQQRFRDFIPDFGQVANPVDLTASVMEHPLWFGDAISVADGDDETDIIVLVVTLGPGDDGVKRIADAVSSASKPVLVAWLGKATPDQKLLHSLLVPTFPTTTALATGARALSLYWTWKKEVAPNGRNEG